MHSGLRKLAAFVCTLGLVICICRAQTEAGEALASFGFVNGIDADAPTFLTVNGRPYKVNGYRPGQMTAGGVLRAGATAFAVTNEEVAKPAELSKDLTGQQPLLIFAYLERKRSADGTMLSEIRLVDSPSRPSKEYKWSGLYLSSRAESAPIYINGAPQSLPPMKVVSLPIKGSLEAALEKGQTPVVRASPDEPGHYMLIVYDKKDGGFGALLFPDSLKPR
jgi:hypothetical protein